ncbi:hypothetical protein HF086_011845 [Spodoptera exigua]|uniref:Uncharacterized protein n=1 Tax=Spodoptera exigua TaxID=7107 RepID=A0A922MXS5_SPOEX|nr:hypothetical protein HF086_011845 [Spodoptera exigua]
MQVIIPLLFGMKSAGMAMFAMAIVTVLTLKAFLASKVALLVTVGMAVKKLYETYGSGVGLQNHPYLYSQYPIDFPSASSHAYSVSGVSPQFASPEMYSPTAMGAHGQTNEIIHQSDASAQQSQQAPTLLVNSTRAEQRWDGKSKLLKFLEPIIDGIKYVIDPIANVFFGAMPATFRGLTSDASKAKSVEPVDDDLDELEIVKKPRQILVPQPRNIAQRKMTYRKNRNRPKKYADLKVTLDRLKQNKDLHDYIKTKKYKFNYPNTYFYPRVKYFVNPNTFYKPNNSRLMPYRKEVTTTETINTTPVNTDWKPIVVFNKTLMENVTEKPIRRRFRRKQTKKRLVRSKRSIDGDISQNNATSSSFYANVYSTGRSFLDFLKFLFETDPIGSMINQSNEYTKSVLDQSLKSEEPGFYTAAYRVVMITLDLFDGIFGVNEALESHLLGDERIEKRRRKKNRRKSINRSQAQTKASGDVQCFMDSRALLQNPFRPTATAIESSPDYDNAHVRNATDVWSPHHNAAVSVNKIGHTHGSSGDI